MPMLNRRRELATERLSVRVKPSEKDLIERGAEAAQVPLSDIIIEGALAYAKRALREASRLKKHPA